MNLSTQPAGVRDNPLYWGYGTEEPFIFNSDACPQRGQKKIDIVFPGCREIYVEHIPANDYDFLRECPPIPSEKDSQEHKLCLYSVFNNIFMHESRGIKTIDFKGEYRASVHWKVNRPVLQLYSTTPFTLTVHAGAMSGYASYFLQEMKRLHIEEFSLQPGERLLFFDISVEMIQQIQESPDEFLTWLQSKAPPEMEVSLEGQEAKICHYEERLPWKSRHGIELSTKAGLTIELRSEG
ncbi:MAG: hypothetical protein JSR46_09335 [Verrucomicrobia bacterium]|nr:hypothetical protein [Verrucomicrobiota bacterium]